MPCVAATQESVKSLAELINEVPETKIFIDVVNSTVKAGDLNFSVDIPTGAKEALTMEDGIPLQNYKKLKSQLII